MGGDRVAHSACKRGGRKRSVNVREIDNGFFYVLSTGCQWSALPKDLPPKSRVRDYFDLWDWDGTLRPRACPPACAMILASSTQ
jgi:transposase